MVPHHIDIYSRRNGLPVFRWRYAIPDAVLHALSVLNREIDSVYARYPALSGYFVKGAPVYLTTNLNPNKGTANGTSACLHSLTWTSQPYTQQIALKAAHAQVGSSMCCYRTV
jgi:hypothetical protein